MNTLLIGLKEFRDNISSYSRKLKDGNTQIIVLNKNKPIMEVRYIPPKKDFSLEEYLAETERSLEEAEAGKVHSLDDVCKEFDL